MKKPYLLIAGDCYYPSSDTGDWIGCFETYEEAKAQVEVKVTHEYYTKGKNKGEIRSTHETYVVKGLTYGDMKCDWYEIVNLREWTER
jgi:hypothetical protein